MKDLVKRKNANQSRRASERKMQTFVNDLDDMSVLTMSKREMMCKLRDRLWTLE